MLVLIKALLITKQGYEVVCGWFQFHRWERWGQTKQSTQHGRMRVKNPGTLCHTAKVFISHSHWHLSIHQWLKKTCW